MKEKLKLITGNLFVTLCLLLVVESIFYLVRPKHVKVGFLVNSGQATNHVDDPAFGMTEVDALLGYNKDSAGLSGQGYKIENGCAMFSTSDDTLNALRILITGGSATDVSLHSGKWPVEFCKILKERGVKAKIYVAAIGGFNSGQELLKLIRDDLDLGQLIHISYSGAHEFENPSYVSKYEQAFYEKEFSKANTSWLMPNTVLFMRNLLGMNHPDVFLRPNTPISSVKFWERNMGLMHGTAVEYNYNFIGVLQPVTDSNKHDEKYYPEMQKVVSRHPGYLVDLSGALDPSKPIVNADGNEATNEQVIAWRVCEALEQKGLLKK